MRSIDFLIEANILNGDEIRSIINDIAKDIPDPYKKRFVNTAYSEVVNNPKYHKKVTRLPDGSPAWAEKAFQNKELDTAHIRDEDREYLTQIIHWLQSILTASKISPKDNDERDDKREATNQLQSFLSKMNLTQMKEHERKWFSRHSDKVKGDTSGMVKTTDVGNGWAWWELVSEESFKREGQVLNICVGQVYTAASCKRTGTKIYMLKNKALESALAMRIERGNEMDEVKGQGNKLPRSSYIPMVNKFIQENKIVVSPEGNRDLVEAGYVFDPKTHSITHYSAVYPFEQGPDIGGGLILVKWTAPYDIWKRSYAGLNHVPTMMYPKNGSERYDVVSPKNTWHPQMTFIINQGKLETIGNLYSPNRVVSENGMKTMAQNLINGTKALGVTIPDSFTGEMKQRHDPGLSRYGITVKNGVVSTDRHIAIEVSIFNTPKSIVSIKNPDERLQTIAIQGDANVIPIIDNPTEKVQLLAFQTCSHPHKTMNEYIASHDGTPPVEAAQVAAVSRDGYSIERISDPSETVQVKAVTQVGEALTFLAWNNRRLNRPAPSAAVQIAAFNNSEFAIQDFLAYYKISPEVQMAVVKHYANSKYAPSEIEYIKDTLSQFNSLDPRVESMIDKIIASS